MNIRVMSFCLAQNRILGNVFANRQFIRCLSKPRFFVHVIHTNSRILRSLIPFSIHNGQSNIEYSIRFQSLVKRFEINACLSLDNKLAQAIAIGLTHLNHFEKFCSINSGRSIFICYCNFQFIQIGIIFVIDDNRLARQHRSHIHIFVNIVRICQHLEFRRSIFIQDINNNRCGCRLRWIFRIQRTVHDLYNTFIFFLLCIVEFFTSSNRKCASIGIKFKRELSTALNRIDFFNLIGQYIKPIRMR